MKILITGINGFVGKILHSSLSEKKHEVFGLDLHGNNKDIFAADIINLESVSVVINKIAPDYIIHLAAISKVDFQDPSILYSINVTGTLNVLISAVNQAKKPGVLIVSSSQVYGIVDESRQPISETEPVKPVNHYGASKAASENIALTFNLEYDIPVVIARPFNHIGVGQDTHFVVPKIIKAFKENYHEIELGNISTVRDFLDVRDVADAYTEVIENFPGFGIYNISSGVGVKVSDIYHRLQELTGHHVKINKTEHLLRKNEIGATVGNSSLFRKKFKWKPKYNIDNTLDWMLEL